MVSVAKNKTDLKKRLLRFFDEKSSERKGLTRILNKLSRQVDIYIFGGVVRDIALQGVASFDSDVDVVYLGEKEIIDPLIKGYSATKNKFGGYRFNVDGWQIDLWDVRESWAFIEGYREYSGVKSVLNTTITNWDSILFSWKIKSLMYEGTYFEDLQEGYLDIQLMENPNQVGMLVKILRFYADKDVRKISPKVAKLIDIAVNAYSYDELSSYEQNSYKKTYISESIYSYLKENQQISNPGLFPVELEEFNQSLRLSYFL